jgi:hypothetical protein
MGGFKRENLSILSSYKQIGFKIAFIAASVRDG